MSTKDRGFGFWTTLPGILTAIAGLVTAGTGLLVALDQVGVVGNQESTGGPGDPTVSGPAASGQPSTGDPASAEPDGSALAGTWRGVASTSGGSDPFEVELHVVAPCRLRERCGTISVSSTPCTGRVTLWSVQSRTYEFYVDGFTPDSSSECSEGAGDFFELVEDKTLKYTTDYSNAVGLLDRQS